MKRFRAFLNEMPWWGGFDIEIEKPHWATRLAKTLMGLSDKEAKALFDEFKPLGFTQILMKRFSLLTKEEQKMLIDQMPDIELKAKLVAQHTAQ
jgi:hypothetical protein